MTNHSPIGITVQRLRSMMVPCFGFWKVLFMLALPLATNASMAAPSPAIGDTYVYRVINVYNSELRGQVSYQVDKVDPNRITVSVSSQGALVEPGRIEVRTADGNWVRHALDSHGRPMMVEFPAGAPGYAFPLQVGKRWSMRVPAVVLETGELRSIRIDAAVTGAERIRLPAGEFDTLKITRTIYAGDANHWYSETRIYETEWFAPTLGRAVRSEVRSEHLDLHARRGLRLTRGDWDVYELLEVRAANP